MVDDDGLSWGGGRGRDLEMANNMWPIQQSAVFGRFRPFTAVLGPSQPFSVDRARAGRGPTVRSRPIPPVPRPIPPDPAPPTEVRPLAYRGRIAEPIGQIQEPVWKNSKLFLGYTDMAEQLPSRDMVTVQDISADALPETTDDANITIQGAQKFQQVGPDAMTKLFSALFDGAALQPKMEIVRALVVGGGFETRFAFLNLCQSTCCICG